MGPVLPNDLVTTVVRSVRRLTRNVREFELVQPEDWELPRFTPGAHIDVHVPGGFVRSYSLANDPVMQKSYRIAVSAIPEGSGGSATMHARVREGDWISVSLPKNYFPLAANAKKHVFIAGGIGLTPFLSMIPELRRSGVPFELHMCSPSKEDTPFFEELTAIGGKQVTLYHSREASPSRLAVSAVLARLGEREHVYCCGPERLMEDVRTSSRAVCDIDRVHFERFDKPDAAPEDKPYKIDLARQGRTVDVLAGETMLAALMRHGVAIDFGCEGGTCGKCRTRYLSGNIEHRDFVLSEAQRSSCLMPCVSRPTGESVTVDL